MCWKAICSESYYALQNEKCKILTSSQTIICWCDQWLWGNHFARNRACQPCSNRLTVEIYDCFYSCFSLVHKYRSKSFRETEEAFSKTQPLLDLWKIPKEQYALTSKRTNSRKDCQMNGYYTPQTLTPVTTVRDLLAAVVEEDNSNQRENRIRSGRSLQPERRAGSWNQARAGYHCVPWCKEQKNSI